MNSPILHMKVATLVVIVLFITMNVLPSSGENVIKNGTILINSSLIEQKVSRDDVKAYYIPANEIAMEAGHNRAANIVMLGAYLKLFAPVQSASVIAALKEAFGKKKTHLIAVNETALAKGMKSIS